MKITESKLRKIIRNIINESSMHDMNLHYEEREESSLGDLCSKEIAEIRNALSDFKEGFNYLGKIRKCYVKMGMPQDYQMFFDDLTHEVQADEYYQADDFRDAVALFKEELYNSI